MDYPYWSIHSLNKVCLLVKDESLVKGANCTWMSCLELFGAQSRPQCIQHVFFFQICLWQHFPNLQVWFIKLRANSFLHLINLVCCSYLWFHYAIVLMKPETPFIYYLLQSWSWLFILVIAEYEERVRRKRERRKDIAERRIAKAAAAEAARSAIREREEFVAKLEEEKADLERQLVEWEERQAKEVRILI